MSAKRLRRPILLLLAAAITLLNVAPLVWIAMASLKTRLEIFSIPPAWLPSSFNWENYVSVLERNLPYLLNSLIVTASTTVGVLVIGLPAAFALSVFRFRRKQDLEMWILSTRMLPPIAAAVPLYIASNQLGLIDTRLALVLIYMGFNLSFAVWLGTSFMRQVPPEIIEAARVDGCSWWQVFLRIAMPLTRGGVATVSIFISIFAWNELLIPLFMTNRTAKTFTVVLTEFQGQTNTVWELMAAASTIQLLPIIVLVFFMQRYIVQGLTMGAVK